MHECSTLLHCVLFIFSPPVRYFLEATLLHLLSACSTALSLAPLPASPELALSTSSAPTSLLSLPVTPRLTSRAVSLTPRRMTSAATATEEGGGRKHSGGTGANSGAGEKGREGERNTKETVEKDR